MDKELLEIIKNFNSTGKNFISGKRNKIKIFSYNDITINVKSFKVPTLINGIIYRYFRKSKAERSYIHAKMLEKKGIGTPKPVAFYENKNFIRLLDSYYICEHIDPDYVLKDLFHKNLDQIEEELKLFTQFTFKLHEKGIEFLDHSPGNTLFKKNQNDSYDLFLVDLNRMEFHTSMDFHQRMKNLSRIAPSKRIIEIISHEYARLYGKSSDEVFKLMWKYTSDFYDKSDKKRKFKEKFNM